MRKFGILLGAAMLIFTGFLMAETVGERLPWEPTSNAGALLNVSTTDTVNGGFCFDFMGSVDCREW